MTIYFEFVTFQITESQQVKQKQRKKLEQQTHFSYIPH